MTVGRSPFMGFVGFNEKRILFILLLWKLMVSAGDLKSILTEMALSVEIIFLSFWNSVQVITLLCLQIIFNSSHMYTTTYTSPVLARWGQAQVKAT